MLKNNGNKIDSNEEDETDEDNIVMIRIQIGDSKSFSFSALPYVNSGMEFLYKYLSDCKCIIEQLEADFLHLK